MSLGRNAAVNLVGAIVSSLVGIVTVPLYLHAIGADRFGVLAIGWLFLNTFGFLDFGLTRATQYRIAANGEEDRPASARTIATAMTLCVPITIVGFALIWFAINYFFSGHFKSSEELRIEVLQSAYVIASCWPVVLFSAVLNGALLGRRRFVLVNISTVASSLLFQLVPLIVAWTLGPNLRELLIAALVGRALPMLGLVPALYVQFLRGCALHFSGKEARALLGYGQWASLTSVIATVLTMADRFLIGALLGPVAVTIYTAPLQLAQRVSMLPAALSGALFPQLPTAAPEERMNLQVRCIEILMGSLTVLIGGGLLLTAPFLDLWLGKTIGGPATPVALLLFFGAWWTALAIISFSGLQASGRPRASAAVQAAELPPFLIGLYFGAKWAGVPGAAAVYLLRSILDYALLTWQAGLLGRTLKPTLVCAGIMTLACLAGSLYRYSVPIWFLLSAAIALALVASGWWAAPAGDRARLAGRLSRFVPALSRFA